MDKRKIIFRADGNTKIGLGHVIRSLALADMLKDEFNCEFATRFTNEFILKEMEQSCSNIIQLPEDEELHLNYFLNLLSGYEIVVLDNYFFTTEYQRQIKKKGCTLVCIDDLADKHYVADLIINHNGGLNVNKFSVETYSRLCLGYKYALLRAPFLENEKNIYEKKYSCFIMIGGTDSFNLTGKILANIELQKFEKPFAVVINANSKFREEIKVFDNCIIFSDVNAKDIKTLMQESVFGIIPASTSAIEACAVRLPFVTGFYVNNQEKLYDSLKENGLAICLDDFLELNKLDLIRAIDDIQKESTLKLIIKNQIDQFDNKTKIRFSKIFKEL